MTERIKVHEKALAHLSKGLYRSPASAIRELVSNAWDAGARRVDISTSAPVFSQIVISDNGRGFGEREFTHLMRGGIGNSEKRTSSKPKPTDGRPVLGRLGIGLMGVAQICTRFRVLSRTNKGEVFAAEVRIENSLRRLLDADDKSVVRADADGPEVFIGVWEKLAAPIFDSNWHGTQIVLVDPHPSFVESFVKTLRPVDDRIDEQDQEMAARVDRLDFPSPEAARNAMPSRDWKKTLKMMASKESVTIRGAYWRFLWELAAACPIPYLGDTSVPNGCVKADNERLTNFDFGVFVDGIELRKPLQFPRRDQGYSTRRFERKATIEGRPLVFHGYLLVQDGSQLRPAEIRGVQIRIKDVGVGYYDGTLLDWQVNQGPRSRWVSGEVFVESGLEDAMNVDRDSFNRFHPEFLAVQAAVHTELKAVFKGVYRKLSDRSSEIRSEKAEKQKQAATSALNLVANEPVRVRDSRRAPQGTREGGAFPALVEGTKNGLTVALDSSEKLNVRANQRVLAHAVIALFDLIQRERTLSGAERRRKFIDGLVELLSGW